METKNELKPVIGMLVVFIIMTIIGFMLMKVVEPKLQIHHGTIIDYELQEIYDPGNNTLEASKREHHFTIYHVQDDVTNETSQIRYDNIMFPYNMVMGVLPIRHIVYSTYKNAVLYNIMIGWKVVGILGILVCILFIVKNPYKNEQE